jgi:3-oxoacyl-[acyl-carrier protein] reductase
MDLNLNGRRALVCGSTQGIGKAAALELAGMGASVTLMARDEVKLNNVLKELSITAGQQHEYLIADFESADQVRKVIEPYVAQKDIDILINNTGGPPGGLAIEAQPADFIQAFSNHLICNQILVQAVVPSMRRKKYGRIINVISTSVKIPIAGLGVSNTIRGAVASWAKTLSLELAAWGITVNNILPGSTKTGRIDAIVNAKAAKAGLSPEEVRNQMIAEIPARRMAEASEVAAVIAFLASPAAGYVNGVSLPVDGGRTGSI